VKEGIRGFAAFPRPSGLSAGSKWEIRADKRKNYAAAKQEFLPGVKHRQSRYLNNWPRFRTSRRDGENDRCSGASRRVTPRDFSPPTVGSTTPSSFAATVSLLLDQAARNRAVQAWRDVAGIAGAA
jgi:hypothetical protein